MEPLPRVRGGEAIQFNDKRRRLPEIVRTQPAADVSALLQYAKDTLHAKIKSIYHCFDTRYGCVFLPCYAYLLIEVGKKLFTVPLKTLYPSLPS